MDFTLKLSKKERVHVIRTAVSLSAGEEGGAVEWRLDVKRSTEREAEEERLNHRDKELECVRDLLLE